MVGRRLAALPAAGQVNPEAAPGPAQAAPYKYEAYVGVAYSRIRQVPVSYSGLMGGKGVTGPRLGKVFSTHGVGRTTTRWDSATATCRIPATRRSTPSWLGRQSTLRSMRTSADCFSRELGGEHTGGENMTPSISFAGGFGGGLAYSLSRNFGMQLTGDRVAASFPLPNNTAATRLLDASNMECARDVRRGVPVLKSGD